VPSRSRVAMARAETPAAHVTRLLCSGVRAVQDLCSVLAYGITPDPANVFNTAPRRGESPQSMPRKRFLRCIPPASVPPFELVRGAAKCWGVTVNDLFVTAVTGAMREYLLQYGAEWPFPRCMRVGFTINRHDIVAPLVDLRNLVIMVPVPVPITAGNRQKRLQQVNQTFKRLKQGSKVWMCGVGMHLLSRLPCCIRDPILNGFAYAMSSYVSNVPGPREPISVGGVEIDSIAVTAPVDDRGAGVTFTLFTYNSMCSLSICGDPARVRYAAELESLLRLEFLSICSFHAIKA
jgi:WS/DGAT C-terminal domain